MEKSLSLELAAIEAAFLTKTVATNKPLLLHMLGIPGAGKTTFLNILQQNWPAFLGQIPVLLGFDQVMQSLPSYQATPDKVSAFGQFELPAREAGYRIFDGLLQKKSSFLFDNGGSAASHPDLLKRAQSEHGYQILLVEIVTPLEIARSHVSRREVIAGQHTPLHYLEERLQKLENLSATYRALTPHYYAIQNDGSDLAVFQEKCASIAQQIYKALRANL